MEEERAELSEVFYCWDNILFLRFYWHNTKQKQDNCKVLFRIKNKPEFLLCKV